MTVSVAAPEPTRSGPGSRRPPPGAQRRPLVRWLALLRKDALGMCAVLFLILLAAFVLLQPLMGVDAGAQNLRAANTAPWSASEDGKFHVLGTDGLGRDLASRLIAGARVSLTVGVTVAVCALVVGVALGVTAGYFRSWVDDVIMRIVDLWMAIPPLLVALIVLFVSGPGFWKLILALVVVRWVLFARVVRALTLSIREEAYVEAARSLGATGLRIIRKHILPNMAPQILILATLEISRAMLSEAALSFLGLGVQVPEVSWGTMLADGRNYMYETPWLVVLPGVAIVLTTLSINLTVNWIRRVLPGLGNFKL